MLINPLTTELNVTVWANRLTTDLGRTGFRARVRPRAHCTTPEEFENGGFTQKTDQCFPFKQDYRDALQYCFPKLSRATFLARTKMFSTSYKPHGPVSSSLYPTLVITLPKKIAHQITKYNHKNYTFLDCDWFKKLLFTTNSLAKLLSDSLLSGSSISQSHLKL